MSSNKQRFDRPFRQGDPVFRDQVEWSPSTVYTFDSILLKIRRPLHGHVDFPISTIYIFDSLGCL